MEQQAVEEQQQPGLVLAESPGIIPFFPSIMAFQPDNEDFNTSQCICSDLQHEDYSPLYAWFNYIVIIIMLPSLSAFGVVTNIVNVFVYSRPRMRNSSNTYLLFLACSDFFVVLTGLFIFWIDSARSYIPQLVQAPYTTVYTLPFGYMAQSCSIYFTVAAAFDCYVCVCWRRKSKQHCTVSRAKHTVAGILVLSIFYNSLRFPQFNLRKCIHDGSGEMVVEICPTSLFFRINTIYNVYLYMFAMTLFPFFVLLLLNLLIICRKSIDANRQRQKKRSTSSIASSIRTNPTTASVSLGGSRRSNKENGGQNGGGQQSRPQTHIAAALLGGPHAQFPSLPKAVNPGSDETITMIMVVVLFLCCNTLALIVNLIETFFEPDALLLNLLSDASNFLVIFNSSVNCVIYLIFNSEYREVFFAHFVHFKGRCYPFHLLQCLFERRQRRDDGEGNYLNGGLVPSANPSLGMPTGFGHSEKPLGKFRQRESSTTENSVKPVNSPESPVWLQCPCTTTTNSPAHSHSHHHFCHHCPCWHPNKCAFEWSIHGVGERARLALDELGERDSGCGEENCSSSQQRASIRGSSMCPSPCHQRSAPISSCYLAEVKMIMEHNESAPMPSPPHIYVRPLTGRRREFELMGRSSRQQNSGFDQQQPIQFMDEASTDMVIGQINDPGSEEFPVTAL